MFLFLACADPSALDDTSAELPTSGELSVLSYNVHGLPEAITGDDTAGRIAQIAPLLEPYDLVGVQEDWIDSNHAVLDAACDHTTRLRWNEPIEDRVYGAGLSIWARAPEITRVTGSFETCYGTLDDSSDCLASKGWAMVRLSIGAATLDFYTLHFEAGSGEGNDPARSAQVDQVVAELATTSADHAVLLVGDTNLHGGDPADDIEIAKFSAAGMLNACDLVDCPEPERIDRLLLRDGGGVSLSVGAWEVPGAFVDGAGAPLSDHDPIAITLGWSADPPS